MFHRKCNRQISELEDTLGDSRQECETLRQIVDNLNGRIESTEDRNAEILKKCESLQQLTRWYRDALERVAATIDESQVEALEIIGECDRNLLDNRKLPVATLTFVGMVDRERQPGLYSEFVSSIGSYLSNGLGAVFVDSPVDVGSRHDSDYYCFVANVVSRYRGTFEKCCAQFTDFLETESPWHRRIELVSIDRVERAATFRGVREW